MSILLIGLNHRTAPVELREQLVFSREGVATALMLFRQQFPDTEAAILSTCNRVEMVVATNAERPTVNDMVSFLAQARDLPVVSFRSHLYELADEQAVRHLFRVASGLDSMVVGENQIASQVKQAYAQASEQGTTGRLLNRLFHHAFAVSKRVRSETEIGSGKLSVPSVAVDVAQQIFSDFSNKQTLVIGAGEIAQLVCKYLRQANAERFVVTTRTHANAKILADACRGVAVPFDQLDEQLDEADIVITAVSCPKPILTVDRLRQAQRRRGQRPMFVIDLAVPRNVEPAAAKLQQVFVYDIDGLGRIVEDHQQQRLQQLEACEKILDSEIEAFEQWLAESKVKPLIAQMYQDAHNLSEAELERLFHRCPDLTDQQRDAVAQLAERLIGKFLHPCVFTVRQHSLTRPSATLVKAFRAIAAKRPLSK